MAPRHGAASVRNSDPPEPQLRGSGCALRAGRLVKGLPANRREAEET